LIRLRKRTTGVFGGRSASEQTSHARVATDLFRKSSLGDSYRSQELLGENLSRMNGCLMKHLQRQE